MDTEISSPDVVSTPDLDGIIVVIGGGDHWTATVQLFHVKAREWSSNLLATSSPPPFSHNKLHVIGCEGTVYSRSLQALPSSDEPNSVQSILNTLTWNLLPQLPVKYSTAATLCGQLVIVGGERGGSPVNSIHQLIDGQWVEIGAMSICRKKCLVVTPSPTR